MDPYINMCHNISFAVCCRVLQYCSVLRCVNSVLQCVAVCKRSAVCRRVLLDTKVPDLTYAIIPLVQFVAVWCSVLQRVAMCCSVVQCVAMWYDVL